MPAASLFGDATAEQQAAATLPGAVLVLAGAGTGKTKTLTLGVAHRIKERGILPSRILAVTLTLYTRVMPLRLMPPDCATCLCVRDLCFMGGS